MVYTCAYYDKPAGTLAEAQVAKLDHVCRKLNLQPGQTVIEAGCGWGALALHIAERYGVNVIAYNNSREQVTYALERLAARAIASGGTCSLAGIKTLSGDGLASRLLERRFAGAR